MKLFDTSMISSMTDLNASWSLDFFPKDALEVLSNDIVYNNLVKLIGNPAL
jgi:hypothetical protein